MSPEDVEARTRIVEPQSIEVQKRSGVDILVVTDHLGQEFTTPKPRAGPVPENREKYIGERWKMKYTVSPAGYLNFKEFVEKTDEPKAATKVDELGSDERRMMRQNSQQHASRMVAGLFDLDLEFLKNSEEVKQTVRNDLEEEVEYWMKKFQKHAQTGEF